MTNPNHDKPLASEAEAEALRQGKQDALSDEQITNIAAVPNKRDNTDLCIYANSAQGVGDYTWIIPGVKEESNIWSAGTYKYFGDFWKREDDQNNERCIRKKSGTENTFELVQDFASTNPIVMAEFDGFGPHKDVQIESPGYSAKVDISGAVDYIATMSQLADKYTKPENGIPTDDIANGAITNDKIAAGAIVKGKLAQEVQDSLDKADNAL